MVSKQTKKNQHQSVSPSSKEVVKKKIKMKVVEEKKVRSKSKRGQIKLAQSKKNQKQEDPAKPSIKVIYLQFFYTSIPMKFCDIIELFLFFCLSKLSVKIPLKFNV